MLETRSKKLERIDTGDYTPEEYARFLREIASINRFLGDRRALRKTLLADIAKAGIDSFSILDVGAGSGQLLRTVADFAAASGKNVSAVGLDMNAAAAKVIAADSDGPDAISVVRGDAFRLPFDDGAFDYVLSSLFTHHLDDEQIVAVLREMSRVARRGIYVIDLHRHALAFVLYKIYCRAFGISRLVREDGSLSIRKGFRPAELKDAAVGSSLAKARIRRVFPFRLVLTSEI